MESAIYFKHLGPDGLMTSSSAAVLWYCVDYNHGCQRYLTFNFSWILSECACNNLVPQAARKGV